MDLNGKLKEIFNQVQAEEELKDSARAFLEKKTQRYTKTPPPRRRYGVYAAVYACFLCMLLGRQWLFTPTAEISIDINPSLELGVNRFDRVIAVEGYNDDGRALAAALDVKFMNYADAIDQILCDKDIAALLSNDEIMTITVTGPDKTQSSKILSGVEACTMNQRNTHCYFADTKEVEAAHELGLSCGKYKAYLELQLLDPNITPETVQGMTMREIRDLINELSPDGGSEAQPADTEGCKQQGAGNGHGCGHGNGHGNRRGNCR